MTALVHPLDWHLHIFWTVALPALALLYWRAGRSIEPGPTRPQVARFVLALAALAVATTWPLGDLAAHWSLVALVVQRLLLLLAIPPLLVSGTPRELIVRLTRPAGIDAVLRIAVKPVPAIAFVTAVSIGTLTTGAVALAASSDVARVAFQLLVLLGGLVLWAPVLAELPGVDRLSSLGRGGYLIVQSIVPSFLCIVWIFAKRPLYAAFDHHGTVFAMSPVLDQQVAGFLAKLTTIAVLWTVAFITMTRVQAAGGVDEDGDPLMWSDVQREIERADRRRKPRSPFLPPARPADPDQ
jgi:cytochrome c oxidase assembly factor CtaG